MPSLGRRPTGARTGRRIASDAAARGSARGSPRELHRQVGLPRPAAREDPPQRPQTRRGHGGRPAALSPRPESDLGCRRPCWPRPAALSTWPRRRSAQTPRRGSFEQPLRPGAAERSPSRRSRPDRPSAGTPGARGSRRSVCRAARLATTSSSTSSPSGSSLTAATAGPANTRCAPVRGAIRLAKASSTPAGSLRRSQRDTWITYGVDTLEGRRATQVGASVDAPGSAVSAHEDGASWAVARLDSRAPQDGTYGALVEVLVLRRERVDRRRNHEQAVAFQVVPGEGCAREDVQLRIAHEREQESPRLTRLRVGLVDSDVAAPDDPYPAVAQRTRKAGRLGIVQEGYVARPHEGVHGADVAVHRVAVYG